MQKKLKGLYFLMTKNVLHPDALLQEASNIAPKRLGDIGRE